MSDDRALTNRWLMLCLLIAAYALNGADRQMIAVLAEPIRADLQLSDSELGMLSGFLFAVFYSVVGVPIAWLADRANRVHIVAGACLFWSGCTAASGLSQNFTQLAFARVGVAVGEAGCAPPSYSLISDYFRPGQRATAIGLFSVGFPLGVGAGTAFGAWVAAEYGWRQAFFAMAVPGLLLSTVLVLFVRHPRRGRLDQEEQAAAPPPPFLEVLADFARNPVLRTTALAGCLSQFSCYALIVWIPAFLMRGKGMTMLDIAQTLSVVSGGAMMVGMAASGLVVDRMSRWTPAAAALVPGVAFLTSVPMVLAAILVPDWRMSLACLVVPYALMVMWLPPSIATLQNASRPDARAVTSSIFLVAGAILGSGGGPAFVGLLSDFVARSNPEKSLHWALLAVVPVFLLASLAHFATAAAIRARARQCPPVR